MIFYNYSIELMYYTYKMKQTVRISSFILFGKYFYIFFFDLTFDCVYVLLTLAFAN